MTIKKAGSAHWSGSIKEGKGTVSTESGALKENPYGFNTRFEGQPGTNPEELLGAAHAACFSMAFSLMLGNAGYTADSIDTKAEVSLDQDGDGFTVSGVHLITEAAIPGIAQDEFDSIINSAKEGCPVSKLYDTEITLSATLKG
ncbi:OsmC family protein [Carnimonas nigrificans]|uniref:OsmC family protein n=1 Tax=Carnimonas nigrificans TaxID=64323 RepID=UPI00046FD91D|nr:OsmC family protein [Carnimonas nigrificans]